MNPPCQPNPELEHRVASRLLDVLIRAGMILALTLLCYRIFAPFMSLMMWGLILAVMFYPLHQILSHKLGGRQGLAATLLVVVGIVLITGPAAALMGSAGDVLHQLITDLRNNTLAVPAPSANVEGWPIIGKKVYAAWSKAHTDLPAVVANLQPKMGDITKTALKFAASIGGGLLQFIASFIIAGIMMAYGEGGARGCRDIFLRIVGPERGGKLADLSTSTIRAVALGVIGIAAIQSMLIGGALLIAGVPWAGVLAVIVLVLGIAQVPAIIVILPAIIYIWVGGDYTTTASIGYTVMLLLAGSADNVLKPLLLGRGVDAPMPVVLIGALGGLATTGILGMFVGAVLLALGYKLFMNWVEANPDRIEAPAASNTPADA